MTEELNFKTDFINLYLNLSSHICRVVYHIGHRCREQLLPLRLRKYTQGRTNFEESLTPKLRFTLHWRRYGCRPWDAGMCVPLGFLHIFDREATCQQGSHLLATTLQKPERKAPESKDKPLPLAASFSPLYLTRSSIIPSAKGEMLTGSSSSITKQHKEGEFRAGR